MKNIDDIAVLSEIKDLVRVKGPEGVKEPTEMTEPVDMRDPHTCSAEKLFVLLLNHMTGLPWQALVPTLLPKVKCKLAFPPES